MSMLENNQELCPFVYLIPGTIPQEHKIVLVVVSKCRRFPYSCDGSGAYILDCTSSVGPY